MKKDTSNVKTHTNDIEDPGKMKEIRFPEVKNTDTHEREDIFMTKAEYMMKKIKNRKNA